MGALNLDYRDFARQYSYIHQLVIRNHCRCYLIMLTMESTGETSPSIEKAEQALLQWKKSSVRVFEKFDICNSLQFHAIPDSSVPASGIRDPEYYGSDFYAV